MAALLNVESVYLCSRIEGRILVRVFICVFSSFGSVTQYLMQQLEPSQRESIKKISTDRLRTKLTDAGFDVKQITYMTREQLLDACTKVVLSSKDVLPPAAAAKAPIVRCGVELERMRLEFKMKKFEVEESRR
jgi:hypothetical protein